MIKDMIYLDYNANAPIFDKVKDDIMKKEYSGDNSLFLNEAKNFQFTTIEDSIGALYDWYNTNKQIIDKELFEY